MTAERGKLKNLSEEKIIGETVEKVAGFIVKTQFSDLPDSVIHETKRVLLDSIGCAISGVSTDLGRSSVDLAKRLGGSPESTIIGTDAKVSCANAAFANGELINALDFDGGSAGHDTPYVIAAALALAEHVHTSGQDLILAIALGHEIAARLIQAEGGHLEIIRRGSGRAGVRYRDGSGSNSATIAAAASVAKILKLNPEQVANTIGIASYLCPPNVLRKFHDTTPIRMTKYGPPGWGAHIGVISALLAESGFTGDTGVFEGEDCFWKFSGHKQWNVDTVTEKLGTKWIHKISYKVYPVGL